MHVSICRIFVYIMVTVLFLLGKCAEYNAKGAVVQQHERLDCKMFAHPCPEVYSSDKAYLCKFKLSSLYLSFILLIIFVALWNMEYIVIIFFGKESVLIVDQECYTAVRKTTKITTNTASR